jgi:hypothetical protein
MAELFGDMTAVFQLTGIIMMGLLIFAGIGLFIWWYYKQLQFKIPITIHKVLGDGTITEIYDKARHIKKGEKNELKLRKLKEIVPNPPNEYYVKSKVGERIYMRWDGGHVFVPQKVEYNSPLTFKPATYNMINQMAWRVKNSAERHRSKNFWDMYGSMVMWIGVVMISAITLWILFSKLELTAGAINNLASAVNNLNVPSNTQVIQ